MTYELAKNLKDAGFPKIRETTCTVCADFNPSKLWDWPLERIEECKKEHQALNRCVVFYFMPSLEELIKACGDMGEFHLVYDVDGWWATDNHFMLSNLSRGSDPSETIAKLWLRLNI